ncbi:MAG: pyrimidine 5'-nucleotidase, partial [Pseudomonadota bacterium]
MPRQRDEKGSFDRRVWIFDLDNTLYPRSARLFDQIDRLMTAFIAETLGVAPDQADRIRRDTWARYGATLTGLIAEHGVDPEAFLDATHRLDLTGLSPDPRLARAIGALPGRCIIHTNGPRAHAARVLQARG